MSFEEMFIKVVGSYWTVGILMIIAFLLLRKLDKK